VETVAYHAHQLVAVMSKPRAKPTHRKRRPNHQWVPEVFRVADRVLDSGGDIAFGDIRSGFNDEFFEYLSVFAPIDGVKRRTNELNIVFLQDAFFVQCHGGVQCSLTTEGRQNRVWPLFLDDGFQDSGGDGLDVGLVGKAGIRHDCRRVGVHQNDPHALFAENAARLRARVVKFCCLANDNWARTNNEDAGNV